MDLAKFRKTAKVECFISLSGLNSLSYVKLVWGIRHRASLTAQFGLDCLSQCWDLCNQKIWGIKSWVCWTCERHLCSSTNTVEGKPWRKTAVKKAKKSKKEPSDFEIYKFCCFNVVYWCSSYFSPLIILSIRTVNNKCVLICENCSKEVVVSRLFYDRSTRLQTVANVGKERGSEGRAPAPLKNWSPNFWNYSQSG